MPARVASTAAQRPQGGRSQNPPPNGAQGDATARAAAPLSRRIEQRFSGAQAQPRRATFSLGRGFARVHVVLQSNGNTATLVAICRPELQGVVASALARARLVLAARGIVVDLQTKGSKACSSIPL